MKNTNLEIKSQNLYSIVKNIKNLDYIAKKYLYYIIYFITIIILINFIIFYNIISMKKILINKISFIYFFITYYLYIYII